MSDSGDVVKGEFIVHYGVQLVSMRLPSKLPLFWLQQEFSGIGIGKHLKRIISHLKMRLL